MHNVLTPLGRIFAPVSLTMLAMEYIVKVRSRGLSRSFIYARFPNLFILESDKPLSDKNACKENTANSLTLPYITEHLIPSGHI